MKKVGLFSIFFVLLGTLLVSACSGTIAKPVDALAAATATAEGNTPSPMPTETVEVSTPTPSALPTETPIPASATPSRMEFPVQNASLEIKVVNLENPYHVYLSNDLIYSPGEGNMFLDLGLSVMNRTDSDIPLKWKDVYLINKYQDKWYPIWGAYQKTNLVKDPLTVEILPFVVDPQVQPDARVYLGDNGYLRAIFRLPKDNYYYYFSFAGLPLIEIDYRDR